MATGNVLIVDDDPDTRAMLEIVLSAQGFHAVAAEDGLEALHLLRTLHRRAPEVPCLVLLDLKMPRFGGSAFRAAQLDDTSVSKVPVAVISGASDIEQLARTLGAVASVTKPIDFTVLMEVVRRHCVCSETEPQA